MRSTYLIAGFTAAIVSVGCVVSSQAQVTTSQSSSMTSPAVSVSMKDQTQTVSYKHQFLFFKSGQDIAKTITLQPGVGEVSLDGLRRRGTVQLTLVNPSATPLQFETIDRAGGQKVAVIPPHSQSVVSFDHKNGKDVKFFVMQEPDNAVATNQDYTTQQAAAVATPQTAAIRESLDRQTALMTQSQDSQTAELKNNQEHLVREAMNSRSAMERRHERRSAVRGYW